MNHKLTIAVLVVLIVIIWGMVAYRLKSYTPLKPETRPEPETVTKDTILRGEKSYPLRGDYPDPFLGKGEKKNAFIRQVVKEKRPIVWPDLLYKGHVAGKNKWAIVIKNRQTLFLRPGEWIEDARLERVEEDFIVLKKQGKRNIIQISKLSEETP